MATNWPQQVNPRAWRSARVSRTACSNSKRGKNCNNWEKMLHTRFKAESPVLRVGSCHGTQPKVTGLSALPRKPNLDKLAACRAPATRGKRSATLASHLPSTINSATYNPIPLGDYAAGDRTEKSG